MEHTLGITAAALLLTAVIVLGLFALSGFFEKPEALPPAKQTAAETEEPAEKLVLGIYEGNLALFIGESSYPNKIYEFSVSSLPQSDRQRLEKGIAVANEEELFALLEDLTS